jgi:hypothetical protein
MTSRYKLEPLHRNVPDEDLLSDLRRVAHELEISTVSIRRYDECGGFSASALQRRFGSWHAALERAGLKRVRYENRPEEEPFVNLAEIWERLGHQPRMAEMNSRTSRISVDTYRRRFGGWCRALEAFVAWANDEAAPVPRPKSENAGLSPSSRPSRQGPESHPTVCAFS